MSNNTAPEYSETLYILCLEDPYDSSAHTIHTFTDSTLWEWLHEPVSFPNNEGLAKVKIPNTNRSVTITIGSATNDKAQALLHIPNENAKHSFDTSIHSNLTEIEFEDYEQTLEELAHNFPQHQTYTGYWY